MSDSARVPSIPGRGLMPPSSRTASRRSAWHEHTGTGTYTAGIYKDTDTIHGTTCQSRLHNLIAHTIVPPLVVSKIVDHIPGSNVNHLPPMIHAFVRSIFIPSSILEIDLREFICIAFFVSGPFNERSLSVKETPLSASTTNYCGPFVAKADVLFFINYQPLGIVLACGSVASTFCCTHYDSQPIPYTSSHALSLTVAYTGPHTSPHRACL